MVSTLHDIILMTIWSVHSDETSAAAYRRFVEHNAPPPYPLSGSWPETSAPS